MAQGKTLEIILRARDMASRQFAGVGRSAGRMSDRITAASRRASAALRSITLALLPIGGTFALVMGLRAAIRAGAQFEKSMDRVGALSGATAAQMRQLTAAARQLGQTTQFSATQVAEAQQFFALAGFSTAESLNAIRPALDLAAAGQLDVAEAADITAKIMRGMGIEAANVGNAVDVLAKAMSTANTDLRQLGEAMGFVGPIARSAGKGIEETTAAIQALSNAGIQGEKAGTALRQILLKLASPSSQAATQLKNLGIEILDSQGRIRAIADIVQDFNDSMSDLGSGERLAVLSDVFGARAATGFAALLGQGADEIRKLEAQLAQSAGTAARIAAQQLDNLTGDTVKFKSALESVGITVQRVFDGWLRGAVQMGTGIAVAMDEMIQRSGQSIAAAMTVVRTAGSLTVSVFTTVAETIGSVVGSVAQAIGEFASFATGLFGGTARSMAEAFIVGLTTIETVVTNLPTIFDRIVTNIQISVTGIGEDIRHIFEFVVTDLLPWFARQWRNIFTDIWQFTKTIFTNLGENITDLIVALPDIIRGKTDLADIWRPLTEGFRSAITESLPELGQRELTELENALRIQSERLGKTFNETLDENIGARLASLQLLQDSFDALKIPDFVVPTLPPGQGGDDEGGAGGGGRGRGQREVAQAALSLVESRFLSFGGAAKKTEDLQRDQLAEQKRSRKALEILAGRAGEDRIIIQMVDQPR